MLLREIVFSSCILLRGRKYDTHYTGLLLSRGGGGDGGIEMTANMPDIAIKNRRGGGACTLTCGNTSGQKSQGKKTEKKLKYTSYVYKRYNECGT